MPQHKSAKKRMRTSEKKRVYNKANKSKMKTVIKDLRNTTDKAEAETKYKTVSGFLDRLSTKGIIPKNNIARKKSKLAKFVQGLG